MLITHGFKTKVDREMSYPGPSPKPVSYCAQRYQGNRFKLGGHRCAGTFSCKRVLMIMVAASDTSTIDFRISISSSVTAAPSNCMSVLKSKSGYFSMYLWWKVSPLVFLNALRCSLTRAETLSFPNKFVRLAPDSMYTISLDSAIHAYMPGRFAIDPALTSTSGSPQSWEKSISRYVRTKNALLGSWPPNHSCYYHQRHLPHQGFQLVAEINPADLGW